MQDRIPLYPGRVKMTPVAGQANTYDMVRADDPTQEGTPLNKATFLKDATAALFGLGTGAVPDDVLAELGKYKQYWWRRRLPAGERFIEQKTSFDSGVSISDGKFRIIELAKSITINQSTGAIELSSPESYAMGSISYETAKDLAQRGPCYITNLKGATSDVYYIPANATADTGSNANGSTATIFFYLDDEGVVNLLLLSESKANPPSKKVTSIKTTAPAGDWQYLHSSDRSAYPDSGTSGGYEYEYLGIPFDNAVTAPKIETGSYVGTGTHGQANPNTLTFGAVPQLVIISGMFPGARRVGSAAIFNIQALSMGNGAWLQFGYYDLSGASDGNVVNNYAMLDGTMLKWYSNTAERQLNSTDSSGNPYNYEYIAIY